MNEKTPAGASVEAFWQAEILPLFEKSTDHALLERLEKQHWQFWRMAALSVAVALAVGHFEGARAAFFAAAGLWAASLIFYDRTYPTASGRSGGDGLALAGGLLLALGGFIALHFALFRPEKLEVWQRWAMILVGGGGFLTASAIVVLTRNRKAAALTIPVEEMRERCAGLFLAEFFSGGRFDPSISPFSEWLGDGGIFPKNADFESEGAVTVPLGEAKNGGALTIRPLQVTVEKTRREKNDDGTERLETETVTIFEGWHLLIAPLPRPMATPVALRRARNWQAEDLFIQEKDRVELEDALFEARFDVLSASDFEARRLFTPAAMQRILDDQPTMGRFFGAIFDPATGGAHFFVKGDFEPLFGGDYADADFVRRNFRQMQERIGDLRAWAGGAQRLFF